MPDADTTPLLVYDGHCGFCRRFIPRWRQLTGERVRYAALLDDGDNPLPEVPPSELRRAVHLRLPDGRIVAGAAAVAELGGFTGRRPVFRWLYRHVPGVALACDLGYRAVAANRVVANALTRTFVGPDLRRPRQVLTRWLFLRLLGLTALCAVISWWVQLPGLIGGDGISPAADFMMRVREVAADEAWGGIEALRQVPTLAWLGAGDDMLHALCAIAALGSTLLLINILPGFGLVITWVGYLSLVSVGGVFMGYQWDALLLESLFVALFLVPWQALPGLARAHAPSWAGVWLVRLLVFKLMFLSGIVKLASNDPVWADLSALDYHYWSQPLPTSLSFYAHHAPEWTRDFGIRLMFVIELGLPWLIFSGLRRLRYLAVYGTFALMLLIGLTGNYGYFNLLTATLAIMLFDDGALRALIPARWRSRVPDSQEFPHQRPSVSARVPIAVVASALAALSLGTLVLRLDRAGSPAALVDTIRFTAPLHLASSYGLFATMTTDRPEIEVEGSRDGVDWQTYRFAWKTDALDVAPSFTGPHMPRLDWQMWFAALAGDCRRATWYLGFARRLLEGSPDVAALLAHDPFASGEGPPRYLRSRLWHYAFAAPDERAATGNIWTRESAERAFCPTLELRAGKLRAVELP